MVEPTTSLRPEGFDESQLAGYFTQEERTLSYQGAFSVRLTERELQAARVRVIVAPSYYPRPPYFNKGFNPRKTVTARYTAWQQDAGVVRDGYVDFEPTIIMDYRNEGAITRRWASILMKASLQAMNAVQLAAIESFPPTGLAWATAYIVSSNVRNLELQTLFADEPCIGTGELVGSQAVFWTPGFAPPETMWKFVPDFEGIWHFVRIQCWYFRECQTVQVAQPSAPDEEENSDPDSQLNPPPTGGSPPPPETEDEQDPRNNPDDYSTAPPFEPPQESTETTPVRFSAQGRAKRIANGVERPIVSDSTASSLPGCEAEILRAGLRLVREDDANFANWFVEGAVRGGGTFRQPVGSASLELDEILSEPVLDLSVNCP